MAPIVETLVSLSMFETGGNVRIGDGNNGRAAQRDQGMVRYCGSPYGSVNEYPREWTSPGHGHDLYPTRGFVAAA